MVVRITNTVNTRGKQLVHRLSEVCDGKLKVLNEKKDALQLLSHHTDHCIDFVKLALDKGSDSAVLFSKKTLTQHLQKVKCQRADIPNPEIPVRIQVQMNQLPELQKVISHLGTIIVDGKAYPPVASPGPIQSPVRQQTSPNLNNASMQSIPIQSNISNNPSPQMQSNNVVPVQQQTNQPQIIQSQVMQTQPMQTQTLQPQQMQNQTMPTNQIMQAHRTMPAARSPQIAPMMSPRNNLYSGSGNTPPLNSSTNFQQQQQNQLQINQQACGLQRSFSEGNSMANNNFGNWNLEF